MDSSFNNPKTTKMDLYEGLVLYTYRQLQRSILTWEEMCKVESDRLCGLVAAYAWEQAHGGIPWLQIKPRERRAHLQYFLDEEKRMRKANELTKEHDGQQQHDTSTLMTAVEGIDAKKASQHDAGTLATALAHKTTRKASQEKGTLDAFFKRAKQ